MQKEKLQTSITTAVAEPWVYMSTEVVEDGVRLTIDKIVLKSRCCSALPELVLVAGKTPDAVSLHYAIKFKNGTIKYPEDTPLYLHNIEVGDRLKPPIEGLMKNVIEVDLGRFLIVFKKPHEAFWNMVWGNHEIVVDTKNEIPVLKEIIFRENPLERFVEFMAALENLNNAYEFRVVTFPDITSVEGMNIIFWDMDLGTNV